MKKNGGHNKLRRVAPALLMASTMIVPGANALSQDSVNKLVKQVVRKAGSDQAIVSSPVDVGSSSLGISDWARTWSRVTWMRAPQDLEPKGGGE